MLDRRKRQLLSTGDPLTFSAPRPKETPAERADRTIQAQWIADLIAHDRVVAVPVCLDNAIVDGDLQLASAILKHGFVARGCTFTGSLDFTRVTSSEAITLQDCTFDNDVSFHGARADSDIDLSGSSFSSRLLLNNAFIRGTLRLRGSRLGPTDFSGSELQFDIEATATTFLDQFRAIGATVRGQVQLRGVTCCGPFILDGIAVSGGFFVEPYGDLRSSFRDEFRLTSAELAGQAAFTGVLFAGLAQFEQLTIHGSLMFLADSISPDAYVAPAVRCNLVNFATARFNPAG